METDRKITPYTPAMPKGAWQALTTSSLWLRVGFIGASAVAAGLVLALRSEANPLSALALVLGGGLLAAASWRHARNILERADAWDVDVAGVSRRAAELHDRSRPALPRAAVLGGE
jgi:hypothetical protein